MVDDEKGIINRIKNMEGLSKKIFENDKEKIYSNLNAEELFNAFEREYNQRSSRFKRVINFLKKLFEDKICKMVFWYEILISIVLVGGGVYVATQFTVGTHDFDNRIYELSILLYFLIKKEKIFKYYRKINKSQADVYINTVLSDRGIEVTENTISALLNASYNAEARITLSIKDILNSEGFKLVRLTFFVLIGYFADGLKEYAVKGLVEFFKSESAVQKTVLDSIFTMFNNLILVYVIVVFLYEAIHIIPYLYIEVLEDKILTLALRENKES